MPMPLKQVSRSRKPGAEVMIYGDFNEVRRLLFALSETLSPQRLTLYMSQVLKPFIQQRAAERFANEGDEVSGPWAELSEATVAIRENMGLPGAHPINVRTGQLQEFVTTTGDVYPTAMQSVLAMPSWQGVGGDPQITEKLQTAQLGSPDGKTQPRPVLGLGAKDMTFALISLAAFIEENVAMRTHAATGAWGSI